MNYTNTAAEYQDGDESGTYWAPESPMSIVLESEWPNKALSLGGCNALENGEFDVQMTTLYGDGNGDVFKSIENARPVVVCRDAAMATAITNALNVSPSLIEAAPELLEALEEAAYLAAHGIGAVGGEESNRNRNINEIRRIQEKIRAAIAKAKGETP